MFVAFGRRYTTARQAWAVGFAVTGMAFLATLPMAVIVVLVQQSPDPLFPQ